MTSPISLTELQRMAEEAQASVPPEISWFLAADVERMLNADRREAEFVHALSPDTAKKLIAAVEVLQLVHDLASQEWQQADGKRMGATDNQGRRMWFISQDVMQETSAALEPFTEEGTHG